MEFFIWTKSSSKGFAAQIAREQRPGYILKGHKQQIAPFYELQRSPMNCGRPSQWGYQPTKFTDSIRRVQQYFPKGPKRQKLSSHKCRPGFEGRWLTTGSTGLVQRFFILTARRFSWWKLSHLVLSPQRTIWPYTILLMFDLPHI